MTDPARSGSDRTRRLRLIISLAAAGVIRAGRRIAAADGVPRLADLAAGAGMSPYHFHRIFKAVTGLTPHQYAAADRADQPAGRAWHRAWPGVWPSQRLNARRNARGFAGRSGCVSSIRAPPQSPYTPVVLA